MTAAAVSRHVLADAPDEHSHLVRDVTGRVRVSGSEHCQAAALAGGRDEQECRLHLDDGLPRQAAAEVLADAPGEALEAGRDGGQMLGIVPAQSRMRRSPVRLATR